MENIRDGSAGRMSPVPSPRNKGDGFPGSPRSGYRCRLRGTEVPMPEKNRWPYADLYMGDGWSVAYRTLDAQYWGVPQRRRRIYLVADFAGGSAGEILFESEACLGILRRASARGKELPEVLRLALERQALMDTTAI